jgi:hypothetical protein
MLEVQALRAELCSSALPELTEFSRGTNYEQKSRRCFLSCELYMSLGEAESEMLHHPSALILRFSSLQTTSSA